MWYPTRPKSKIKLTIKELAAHFGVHRNTASKWCRGIDRSDFFACHNLVKDLEAKKRYKYTRGQ